MPASWRVQWVRNRAKGIRLEASWCERHLRPEFRSLTDPGVTLPVTIDPEERIGAAAGS